MRKAIADPADNDGTNESAVPSLDRTTKCEKCLPKAYLLVF